MKTSSLIERDRAHLWHPYTQMATAPPPLPIVRARGRVPLHRGRPAAARRHLVVVGEHPRPRAPAIEPRAGRAGAAARTRDVRRLHARAGRRPRGAARRDPAARPDARLLLRQRIDGGRSGAEARAPVLAQSRSARAAHVHHAAPRVSRRHRRRDVGQRGFGLYTAVRAAAFHGDPRRPSLLLSLPARPRAGQLPDRLLEQPRSGPPTPRRRRRRRPRRADAAGGRRHDRLAARISGGRAAALRSIRDAAHRRRSAHGIRPNRPDVRVRARRRWRPTSCACRKR